jgi:hypothetical protein
MSVKGILAAAAVVIASLVSASVTQPAFAAGGTPGSIDTSFGHNGTVITDLGLTAAGQAKLGTPRAVIVLGNGDILVGGDTDVVRLRPTGLRPLRSAQPSDPPHGKNCGHRTSKGTSCTALPP